MHAPKDIRELRQAGQLQEAYSLASEALKEDPSDLYIRREMGWVLYETVKKAVQEQDLDAYRQRMEAFFGLDLVGADEAIVQQNMFRQGVNALFKFFDPKAPKGTFNTGNFNRIIGYLDRLEIEKPSEEYSWQLRAILRVGNHLRKLADLLMEWDLTHLRSEDFHPEEYKGRRLPSLAEKAYNALGRQLCEGKVQPDPFGGWEKVWNTEAIREWLPRFEGVLEDHPNWWFLHLYRARMMRIAEEPMAEVRMAMLPLVKKKSGDFWVWQELAETYSDDPELQMACLSRALQCKSPPKFLVNIHQSMAEALIRQERFDEARGEIEQLVRVREKEGWKLPGVVQGWRNADWYAAASNTDNRKLYRQLAPKAEAVLYEGIPERVAVIDGVHPTAPIAFFRISKTESGKISKKALPKRPDPGDLLWVRVEGRKVKGKETLEVLTARPFDSTPPEELVRDFSGPVKRVAGKPFAFVEDIFLPPELVSRHKLEDGQSINGRAVISFNKARKEWNWKAVRVQA